MQNRNDILQQLIACKSKRKSIRLKITHEQSSFVADIDDILTDKEVVKLKPADAGHASLRRTSYYVDEIEAVEHVGFLSDFSLKNLFN
jgi:hypothetical protein